MRFAKRLLNGLSSFPSIEHGWAADADRWIREASNWPDDSFADGPPCPQPVRVVMDAPGRRATCIKVYERNLLLATLERAPVAAGSDYGPFTTVRIEWRARVAGERRALATSLLTSVCGYAEIFERYGVPHIVYPFDHERPLKTCHLLEWPAKQAAVIRRVEKAYEPRQKNVIS